MHVLLFYPPVVLTTANPKETAAATGIHQNAAELCSKMDNKNGVCDALATAEGKVSDLGIDLESDLVNTLDGDEGGDGEPGVDVQPLRTMEKIIRDSAENFRGRWDTNYLILLKASLPLHPSHALFTDYQLNLCLPAIAYVC